MSGKRSFVWQHFEKISGDSAKCSICDKVLCSTATSGLIKHLRTHGIEDPAPEVKKERPEAAPTVSFAKRSWVWKYFTKSSTSSADCGICGKSIESKNYSTSGMRKHLQVHQLTESCEENSDIEVQEENDDEDFEAEIPASSKEAPRSWVWGFFKKASPITAKCGVCDRAISCKNSSTTGMINHLKTHMLTQESHGERIFQSDEENETFDDESAPGGSKSWVWKYFTKLTADSTKCGLCGRQITSTNSGTTGMINHLKLHDINESESSTRREKRKAELLEVMEVELPNDWVWKYFEKIDDTSARCEVCKREIAFTNSSTSSLLVHLEAHGLTVDSQDRFGGLEECEPKKRKTYVHNDINTKSWVWEFFIKRVASDSAKCKICEKFIACKNSTTTGMINHLKLHDITPETLKKRSETSLQSFSDANENPENVFGEDKDSIGIVSSQRKIKMFETDDRCFICNSTLGSLRNQLTKRLGFTGTPLYEVLESFTGTELSDEAMVCLAICQECFITIEQYDEHQQKSQEIQRKICRIYQQTHGEQIFIKQEPLDEPASIDFKCQKCGLTFATLNEMTSHNHASGHANNSNSVSKKFQRETKKQGLQYDLDTFQRAFFSPNELQASKPGRPALTIRKVQVKENEEVTPEFKKLAEAQGIEYNMETFRRAFGFSEQETASVRKPAIERQQRQAAKKPRKINENFAEALKAEGIEYNLETFQKAFGFSDSTDAEVKERFEIEKDNDAETLRKKGFLQCDDCPFKSTNRVAFYKHLRVHVPVDKNLQCETCEKIFKNETLLEVHKVIDHSDGPYECPICQKSSPDKNTFRSHYNIHKLERNLLCMKCGATFAHKRSFTMHMMIHDDVRPFPCEFEGCSKSFRTAVKQKAHHRVHTGEKIFECPHCPGKMFAQAWGRELHLKKLHQQENVTSVSCNICGSKFVSAYKLKQHQASVHDVLDATQTILDP